MSLCSFPKSRPCPWMAGPSANGRMGRQRRVLRRVRLRQGQTQPFHASVLDGQLIERSRQRLEVRTAAAERSFARAQKMRDLVDRKSADVPRVMAVGNERDCAHPAIV